MKAVNVDDVLKILHKYGTFIFVTDSKKYLDMENEIANLPSVIPKQRTGKWIYDRKSGVYRCSYCNRFPCRVKTEPHDEIFEDLARVNAYKFCPHCGAKMEPLDDVLDEIKAEIPKLVCCENEYRQALVKVADVIKCIDKHKAEREEEK